MNVLKSIMDFLYLVWLSLFGGWAFFWLLSWVWGGKHQQGVHNGFQRIHCNYFFAYYSL